MARKRRVPEVLWRLFHDRARTLAETIVALIPPAAECKCRGRRCLSCSGEKSIEFILRPEDPYEYRKLLNRCFVVVSQNAPPLTKLDFSCRWPQDEIVRRSIEFILYEQPSSSNLICCSNDKSKCSSDVFDSLTNSAWVLLQNRIGDALMLYILKHTSIFLPMPQNKHHQITGFPISEMCLKIPSRVSNSETQHQPIAYHGKKRKRVEPMSEKQTRSGFEPSSHSNKFPSSNGSSCVCSEKNSVKNSKESSEENIPSSRKRSRQYSWQRQRKRKGLAMKETSYINPCEENSSNIDHMSRLENGLRANSVQIDENSVFDCSCCLVFQNVPKMTKNAEIDRHSVFYRMERSQSMLPKKHILHMLKPSYCGATILFENIFGISGVDKNLQSSSCFHSKSSSCIRSTCLYHSLIKLLKGIIRNSRSCQVTRLLDKHCATRETGTMIEDANAENSEIISEAINDQVDPSESHCQKEQITSFIWAICRNVVPSQLLGTPSNWRILRKNISKFIRLRKYEKFSAKQCMHKLKLTEFPLLSKEHFSHNLNHDEMKHSKGLGITDTARHTLFSRWIVWFFSCLVLPIIQANFYVTESEHQKQEVLYYRKSTWQKLMIEQEKLLKDQSYRQLNNTATRKILSNRSFGFSRVRFRPKQSGFRVLANLQAPSKIPLDPLSSKLQANRNLQRKVFSYTRNIKCEKYYGSINSVLHNLHVILKGIQTKEPEKLSSSVFDYNDVHRKLVPFLFLLKNGAANNPGVFIVVSDVSKAFDSIDQDKLLSVMKDVILHDEYTLEKFIQVICTKNSMRVHQHLTLADQDVEIVPRLPAHSLDSVLVKKALNKQIKKKDFDSILQEQIKHNVVQFDNKFYLQTVGIPQGSVLSTLLCSFYYGHMERNVVFPFLNKAREDFSVITLGGNNLKEETSARTSKYLLLRFIDDFLFISTSKKQASMFFTRLERGVREYNCCMNKEKYGLNFNMNHSQEFRSNRLYVGKDGVSFLRWSGLLVNCHTLEIQADYTRYLNSHLSSTLTVICQGKVGHKLKSKLCGFLRPKCYPIFYDSNVNSRGVVRLNIYQVFLLCAMKVLCYLSNLSTVPKFSAKFYIDAIDASLSYMHRLIKRKIYTFKTDATFRPKYDVKKDEVIWLGLYAYHRVIKKKQSRCKELFHLLKSKLKAHDYKLGNMSPELKYAVDDTHSSVFWRIKY